MLENVKKLKSSAYLLIYTRVILWTARSFNYWISLFWALDSLVVASCQAESVHFYHIRSKMAIS